MTAEQIINRFINEEGVKFDQEHDDWMIEAMEEYAAQFKSAATPPDVEQMAEDCINKYPHFSKADFGLSGSLGEYMHVTHVLKAMRDFAATYQAGQSAVQDATPRPPDVERYKKILRSFYQFLENNDKFPNTSGWAEFWADKYLEWEKNHPDVLSDVNK